MTHRKSLAALICLLLIQTPLAFAQQFMVQPPTREITIQSDQGPLTDTNQEYPNQEASNQLPQEARDKESPGHRTIKKAAVQEYILDVKNESGRITASITPTSGPTPISGPQVTQASQQAATPLSSPQSFQQSPIQYTPSQTDSSCSGPYILDLDGWYWLTLADRNEEDWLRWYIPTSQTFTIDLFVPSNRDYDLDVYRGCGQQPACTSRLGQGFHEQCVIANANGYVYARVKGWNGDSGSERYFVKGSRGSPVPDLKGYGITVDPPTVNDATNLAVTFQTINEGNKDAPAFNTKLYINDVWWWTCFHNNGLKKLAYYEWCQTNRFTLSQGSYTLKSVADADGQVDERNEAFNFESNNQQQQSLSVSQTPKPDLYIRELSVPSSLSDGVPFSVWYSVGNKGNAQAGHFLTTLSIDNQVWHTCEFSSLAVNQVLGCTRDSITLSEGRHAFKVIADINNEVQEKYRPDNSFESSRYVSASPKPDLYILSLQAEPSSPFNDDSFAITWTTRNKGNARAGRFNTTISINNAPWWICTFNGLEPGDSSGCRETHTPLAAGRYTIFASADATGVISESEEGNNNAQTSIEIQQRATPKPDLQIDELSASPNPARAGSPFSITWGTVNWGEADAGPFKTRMQITSGGQTMAAWDCPHSAGLAQNFRQPCTVATDLAAGSYIIEAMADFYDDVREMEESNNARTLPLSVTQPDRIDAVPIDLSTNPSEPLSGKPFQFTFKSQNAYGSSVPPFLADVYLDYSFFTTCALANIPAGGKNYCTITIPGLSAGQHHLGVNLDPGREIPDENRDNNIKHIPITVKEETVLPDFAITALWTDAGLIGNEPGIISARIENNGGASPASSAGIYIDDALTQTVTVPALGAFGKATVSFTISSIPAGDHAVRVKANTQGVPEQTTSNNEKEKTFTWGLPTCTIPDGSGPACTCQTAQDCPASRPYCENDYPSPVNDGYDACVLQKPLYCGDGICNGSESQATCSTDCGSPTATLTVTVNQQGKPLQDATVNAGGFQVRTNSFGKALFALAKNKGYPLNAQCPTGEHCTSTSIYLGASDASQTIECPQCPKAGDYDADGYPDQDEDLVGTDKRNPSSNFGQAIRQDISPTFSSCLNVFSWFSTTLSPAQQAPITAWLEEHSTTEHPTTATIPAGIPLPESANLSQDPRPFLQMNQEADEVSVIESGGGIIIMLYDAETGISSWFKPPPKCAGELLGLGKGVLGTLWSEITGLGDLIKAGLDFLRNDPSIDKVNNGLAAIWNGLAAMFSNISDTLYSSGMEIFQDGKDMQRTFSLTYAGSDYHNFQIGYFNGYVSGWTATNIALLFVGGEVIIGKVAKAMKVGLLVEKAATPLARLISRLSKISSEAARIIGNSQAVHLLLQWGDDLAERGMLLYANVAKDGAKIDAAVRGARSAQKLFSNMALIAERFGDNFASLLAGTRGGLHIIEHWTIDEVRKFKKVLETLGQKEADRLADLTAGDYDTLKHVSNLMDSRMTNGDDAIRALGKQEFIQVSKKIAKNFGRLEKELGPNIVKEVASTADDQIALARGADRFIAKADSLKKPLDSTAPYLNKAPNPAKVRVETMKQIGELDDVDGIQATVGKLMSDADGGVVNEVQENALFRKQGHTVKGINKIVKNPLNPNEPITDLDSFWESAKTGTRTHEGIDISGKRVGVELKQWNWDQYPPSLKRHKIDELEVKLLKLQQTKLGYYGPKTQIDVVAFQWKSGTPPRVATPPPEIRDVLNARIKITDLTGKEIEVKAVDWVMTP